MAAAGTRSGASRWASRCQIEGAFVGAFFRHLRLGSQQHRATAIGNGLVDEVVALGQGQRVQGASPQLGAALQIENRLQRPAQARVERQSALGELARGFLVAFALGLQEQPAQAELLGVGPASMASKCAER